MSKYSLPHIFVLIVILFCSASCAMCKNPVLKGTKWIAVEKTFVADAGTMTITHTLEFTSAKDVMVREHSYLPEHPAMYMNADGTVTRIPARESNSEYAGKYKYRRGILTITDEEGSEALYFYKNDGTLVRKGHFEEMVFSREKE